jgi:predicted TIM-barrel fold metal-dependent hydrolase
MDANGLLGSLNFPSLPGFAGRLFAAMTDKDAALALNRAYNDWHIEDWCGSYPGRHIPMALPMLWSPEATAAEIRRVGEKGCHSLTFTENPATLGLPSFHSEHWDPMWEALVETGTILNIHLGSSGQLAVTAPDAPMDVMITLQPMNICMAAADLVWSRVFKKYGDLRVALSEGGTGWIPYFLDRLDRTYDMHHLWTQQDFGRELPSDVFRRHILTCFIADPVGIQLRHAIGIDNICWEQDYPHSDSSWPTAPEELHRVATMYDVPDEELNKITHENAMRWYQFDPFAHRSQAASTVGALRAEVAGHDVTVRAMDKGRRERSSMSLGELAEQATG